MKEGENMEEMENGSRAVSQRPIDLNARDGALGVFTYKTK